MSDTATAPPKHDARPVSGDMASLYRVLDGLMAGKRKKVERG